MKTKIFTILAALSLLVIFSVEPAEAKRKPKHKSGSSSKKRHGLFGRKKRAEIQIPSQNGQYGNPEKVYYAFV